MIIVYQGQRYDITNWDEFSDKLLKAIGFQIEDQISKEINNMRLVSTGELKNSFFSNVQGGELIIFSTSPHAPFIEFGTPGTRKGVSDPFGESSKGPNPSRKMPIVKEGNKFTLVPSLKRWARQKGIPEEGYFNLAKHIQEYGMEPMAPMRKVLYNQDKMSMIITKAVNAASK